MRPCRRSWNWARRLRNRSRLTSAGVNFGTYDIPNATMREEIMEAGHMKAAWFTDSEGNLISLAEFAGGSPFER